MEIAALCISGVRACDRASEWPLCSLSWPQGFPRTRVHSVCPVCLDLTCRWSEFRSPDSHRPFPSRPWWGERSCPPSSMGTRSSPIAFGSDTHGTLPSSPRPDVDASLALPQRMTLGLSSQEGGEGRERARMGRSSEEIKDPHQDALQPDLPPSTVAFLPDAPPAPSLPITLLTPHQVPLFSPFFTLHLLFFILSCAPTSSIPLHHVPSCSTMAPGAPFPGLRVLLGAQGRAWGRTRPGRSTCCHPGAAQPLPPRPAPSLWAALLVFWKLLLSTELPRTHCFLRWNTPFPPRLPRSPHSPGVCVKGLSLLCRARCSHVAAVR